jgi:hypothetical protein
MVRGVAEEWTRPHVSRGDRALRIAQRATKAIGLEPRVSIARCHIVELTEPPKPMRGFSDLVVRRATDEDVAGLVGVAGAEPELVRSRFRRGGLCYVGEIDQQILCHTWFHGGPSEFDEESSFFARWALDAGTFWSYDAMTRMEARSSGIFVKLFTFALREVFEVHGARRIQGFIHHTNAASLSMHERLRFETLGTLTAVAAPGAKFLHWQGRADGVSRQWLVRRNGDLALRFPVPEA